MSHSKLGSYAIYYIGSPINKWSSVDSVSDLAVNSWHDDWIIVNGFACRRATVNGSTPFDIYVPRPEVNTNKIVNGKLT